MNKYENLICKYIKAKDGNKPHLMKSVFSSNASLRMKVQTNNISFPSDVSGLDEITKTLVSEFNRTYENVYTICFADTLEKSENTIKCRWLVGMTERDSKSVRVGFGDYQWSFESEIPNLVKHLTIVIDNMIILPHTFKTEVLSWFDKLSSPWAQSTDALVSMPNISLLTDVRENIA